MKFEKLSKSQGKSLICDKIANQNIFQRIFLSSVVQGKIRNVLEIPWKTQGI